MSRLYQKFQDISTQNPSRLAFTFLDTDFNTTQYTYQQLFNRVRQVAQKIKYLPNKTVIGILLQSQEAQIIHYLAALSCDLVPAILTPPNRKLNHEYYIKTTEKVINYCKFNAIITDISNLTLDVPILTPFDLNETMVVHQPTLVDATFLQFSSGTTGIKRGVLIDDNAIISQLQIYAEAINLNSNDCIVSWLPLYHDMGFIACLNMPLFHGIHTVMIHPIDWVTNPLLYIRAISTYRCTLGWNPNFAYAFMADRVPDNSISNLDLSSIRQLFNCSEPVTKESQDLFLRKYNRIGLNDIFGGCYAMAETTFALTYGQSSDKNYLDHTSNKINVSVGRALPNVELKIVGSAGEEVPDREIGEFWVKSSFNAAGYFMNTEATLSAFKDGWYHTGDLGYKIGKEFFICGRKKDLIIIGGVNIYPNDIEDILNQVPQIRPGRVVAFSTFDPKLQTERATILAETTITDQTERIEMIIEIRKRLLAAFQIANFDIQLLPPEWLVKSTAGKIARSTNKEKWLKCLNS